jgi:hypothetical protein
MMTSPEKSAVLAGVVMEQLEESRRADGWNIKVDAHISISRQVKVIPKP